MGNIILFSIPKRVFLLKYQVNIWNRSTNCRQNTPTHSHTDKTNFTLGWVIHMQLKLTQFANQIILWHDSQYLLSESVNSHAYIPPHHLLVSTLLILFWLYCLSVSLLKCKRQARCDVFAICWWLLHVSKRGKALCPRTTLGLYTLQNTNSKQNVRCLCTYETLSLYWVSSGNLRPLASYDKSLSYDEINL